MKSSTVRTWRPSGTRKPVCIPDQLMPRSATMPSFESRIFEPDVCRYQGNGGPLNGGSESRIPLSGIPPSGTTWSCKAIGSPRYTFSWHPATAASIAQGTSQAALENMRRVYRAPGSFAGAFERFKIERTRSA